MFDSPSRTDNVNWDAFGRETPQVPLLAVRILGGPMEGIEGTVVRRDGDRVLVQLQPGVLVELDGDLVQPC